jgi:hypothetical protein
VFYAVSACARGPRGAAWTPPDGAVAWSRRCPWTQCARPPAPADCGFDVSECPSPSPRGRGARAALFAAAKAGGRLLAGGRTDSNASSTLSSSTGGSASVSASGSSCSSLASTSSSGSGLWEYQDPDCVERIEYSCTTSDGVRLFMVRGRFHAAPVKRGHPVLLVPGLASGAQATWDITPQHSLFEHLARQGYDVWRVDLRGERRARPPLPPGAPRQTSGPGRQGGEGDQPPERGGPKGAGAVLASLGARGRRGPAHGRHLCTPAGGWPRPGQRPPPKFPFIAGCILPLLSVMVCSGQRARLPSCHSSPSRRVGPAPDPPTATPPSRPIPRQRPVRGAENQGCGVWLVR